MERKYELTRESIEYNGKKLYRIRALKDFGNVNKGDLGGYIESEKNLSHDGNCWIYNGAIVCDNARIYGGASACDNAIIRGNAVVYGNAIIRGNAVVCGYAVVFGDAIIFDKAIVYDNASVWGDSRIYGNAEIYNNAKIYGNARIYGNAVVRDNARVYGNSIVYGNSRIYGNIVLCGDARVYGKAYLQYGKLKDDIKENLIQYIACSLNIYPNPVTNTYILYKKVNKISEGVYKSLYDDDFIYRDGEVVEVKDYDPDFTASCSSGLHVSTPFYWNKGDTLIAVEVHVNDIITCMVEKVRCKKLKVLGEVKF